MDRIQMLAAPMGLVGDETRFELRLFHERVNALLAAEALLTIAYMAVMSKGAAWRHLAPQPVRVAGRAGRLGPSAQVEFVSSSRIAPVVKVIPQRTCAAVGASERADPARPWTGQVDDPAVALEEYR